MAPRTLYTEPQTLGCKSSAKEKSMREPTESRGAQSAVVEEAVSKINALRKVARDTGMITKRSQCLILQALTDAEMTTVAQVLAQQEEAANG